MAEIGRENLENIEENERMASGHFRLTTFPIDYEFNNVAKRIMRLSKNRDF